MCGLLLSIRLLDDTAAESDHIFDSLLAAVTPRGPDSLKTHVSHVALPCGADLEVKLAASVLGLRGEGITSQPLDGQRGILGWNGQIFQGLAVGVNENDTTKLFERLEAGEQPSHLLSKVEGP